VNALKNDINICVINLFAKTHTIETECIDEVNYIHIPESLYLTDDLRSVNKYYRNVVCVLKLYITETENLIFHYNYNQGKQLLEEIKKEFSCKIISVIHYMEWSLMIKGNVKYLYEIVNSNKEKLNSFETILVESIEQEKRLYAILDKVICLSEFAKKILQQVYSLHQDKIDVIPNGLSYFPQHTKDIVCLKTKWLLDLDEKIILFVGRMDDVKGLAYLIKAFRSVLSVCPQSRLVIAGDGNFSKYTKDAQDICTKITYTGLLDKAQLHDWYCLADVGVTPSLYEPFGYVAVEMMMHGLPIVATATSGLNEVVDDSCGLKIPLIVHPDRVEIDTDLLAEKILFLLQHPEEHRCLGQNARKRYEAVYSAEIFRRNMIRFYSHLHQQEAITHAKPIEQED